MVSCIITTFKREPATVERALISVDQQTWQDKEILIVDDNEDGSAFSEQIKSLCGRYSQVRYIKQKGNQGVSAARNLGISEAQGDYIAFLDDDDRWLPRKIEAQMRVFMENTVKIGMVSCGGIQFHEDTGEEEPYYTNKWSASEIKYGNMLGYDFVGSASNPLIKKECFRKLGLFTEDICSHEDFELWIRIASKYRIFRVEESLFVYYRHDGCQLTDSLTESHKGYRYIYSKYRDDYRRFPASRIWMLNCIIRSRESINADILKLWAERQFVQIRSGMARNISLDQMIQRNAINAKT